MAVTILQRPEGHILGTGITATITDAPGFPGHPIVNKVGHGLNTGDIVYIESDIEDYNGFLYVQLADPDAFLLQDITGTTYLTYYQDADITYYVSELTHGWSAVHLPITYKLSSDLFPNNNVDTLRIINSVSNDNGSVLVNLSGSLGSVLRYDSVLIDLPNDPDYSGVYTIISYTDAVTMVLDLAYDSGIDFTGATIIKYYNNYNVIVRIYAGIASGHQWASLKPMELATTLEFIPDENGEVYFSVNEVLKSYVKTRNNTLIASWPNNIDFWNNFYISYAESYDQSDGNAVTTYTSEFQSNESNFVGYSVNADLEFKNIYSGSMSEYLMEGSGKFLTNFESPVLFSGIYQDISFIKTVLNPHTLKKQYYLNGAPGLVETETIEGKPGVYRIPIEANCNYDRVDITLSYDDNDIDVMAGTGQLIFTGFAPTAGMITIVTVLPGTGQLIFTGFEPTIYIGPPI